MCVVRLTSIVWIKQWLFSDYSCWLHLCASMWSNYLSKSMEMSARRINSIQKSIQLSFSMKNYARHVNSSILTQSMHIIYVLLHWIGPKCIYNDFLKKSPENLISISIFTARHFQMCLVLLLLWLFQSKRCDRSTIYQIRKVEVREQRKYSCH